MIRKKKFLEKNNVEDMKELLGGEDLDMEAEFNKLDSENNEKVTSSVSFYLYLIIPQVMFSEIIGWAFKKSITRNMAAKK